ncbi:MAG: PilZ domain-containing protein [Candidatus Omnitrophica bacterium]|nr:PilZ domain-containing protein [Candidatus Omnitrophota bacterium]
MTTDCSKYFEEIVLLERAMVYRIHRLMGGVQDNDLINAVKIIVADEETHYGYARLVLESVLSADLAERRRFERQYVFGDIRMVPSQGGGEIRGRCVDVSARGIGFESDVRVVPGDKFHVSLTSYNGKISRQVQGQVVWIKEVRLELFTGNTLHFYMGGISHP